jgi:hypothetical protein
MLRIRSRCDEAWVTVTAGDRESGFNENIEYQLVIEPGSRLIVDDIELHPRAGLFTWQPGFYAGLVNVEVIDARGEVCTCQLQVDVNQGKSTTIAFAEMIATIRAFDTSLLLGTSEATLDFGNEQQTSTLADDILLARMRQYGQAFLDAVESILRAPHQSLLAHRQHLPLSRVRRLHHSALRDRQLAAVLNGTGGESPEDVLIQTISSTSSCDTPANRTLLALLKRFRARATDLRTKVGGQVLAGPKDEQAKRSPRRVEVLDHLISQTRRLAEGQTLRQVSGHGPSASGLTQIAAIPGYQRAYRLGCAALMTGIEGSNPLDQLHSNFSWGIYETWCYVQVLATVQRLLENCTPLAHSSEVGAQLSYRISLPNSRVIEVLFQARFPSEQAERNPLARSISRERYPDILLVDNVGMGKRCMVLDAKWRSGRTNVLEAMESAHIYHDSLRLGGTAPTPCLLLLPGDTCVPSLETDQFIEQHGVGSISEFSAQGPGIDRLERRIEKWLNAGGDCT